MCDAIHVAVRVRKLISRETQVSEFSQWKTIGCKIIQVDKNGIPVDDGYTFDRVFNQNETNVNVYDELCKPIVKSVMEGFNGTLFAYGQTSSGKTHTMLGNASDPGVMLSTIADIFDYIENTPNREFLLRASYLEIYNEQLCDLLSKKTSNLKVMENFEGQVFVNNLLEETVKDPTEVLGVINRGEAKRHIGETSMNEKSSRSHTIFRMVIESRPLGAGPEDAVMVSHLNLVDLAGSERTGRMGNTGDRLREGININLSLLTLGKVISQLSEGECSHVNFRESKLTRILQNSLGGNAKTAIICTVTPAAVDDTRSTLNFASRAKKIKNKPIVNELLSESAELNRRQKKIRQLELEIEEMKKWHKPNFKLEEMQREIRWRDQQIFELEDKLKKQRDNIIVSSRLVDSSNMPMSRKTRRETWCAPMRQKPKGIIPPPTLYEVDESKLRLSEKSDDNGDNQDLIDINISFHTDELKDANAVFKTESGESCSETSVSESFSQIDAKQLQKQSAIVSTLQEQVKELNSQLKLRDLKDSKSDLQQNEQTQLIKNLGNEMQALREKLQLSEESREQVAREYKELQEFTVLEKQMFGEQPKSTLDYIRDFQHTNKDLQTLLQDANKTIRNLQTDNEQVVNQLKSAAKNHIDEKKKLEERNQQTISELECQRKKMIEVEERLRLVEQDKRDSLELLERKWKNRDQELCAQLTEAYRTLEQWEKGDKRMHEGEDEVTSHKKLASELPEANEVISTKMNILQQENDRLNQELALFRKPPNRLVAEGDSFFAPSANSFADARETNSQLALLQCTVDSVGANSIAKDDQMNQSSKTIKNAICNEVKTCHDSEVQATRSNETLLVHTHCQTDFAFETTSVPIAHNLDSNVKDDSMDIVVSKYDQLLEEVELERKNLAEALFEKNEIQKRYIQTNNMKDDLQVKYAKVFSEFCDVKLKLEQAEAAVKMAEREKIHDRQKYSNTERNFCHYENDLGNAHSDELKQLLLEKDELSLSIENLEILLNEANIEKDNLRFQLEKVTRDVQEKGVGLEQYCIKCLQEENEHLAEVARLTKRAERENLCSANLKMTDIIKSPQLSVSTLEHQLSVLEVETCSLKQENELLKLKVSNLQEEMEKLRTVIKQKENDYNIVEEIRKNNHEEVKEKNLLVKGLQSTIETLEVQNKSKEQVMTSKIASLSEELVKLKSDFNEKDSLMLKLKEDNESNASAFLVEKKKVVEREEQLLRLKKDLEGFTETVCKLKEECGKKDQEISRLDQDSSLVDNLRTKLEKNDVELNEINGRLKATLYDLHEREEELSMKEYALRKQQEDLISKATVIEELSSRLSEKDCCLSDLQQKLNAAGREVQQLRNDIKSKMGKLDLLQKEVHYSKERVEVMTSELFEKDGCILNLEQELLQVKEELQRLKKDKGKVKLSTQEERKPKETVNRQMQILQESNSDLLLKLKCKEQQNEDLGEELFNLQVALRGCEKWEHEAVKLQKELELLREEEKQSLLSTSSNCCQRCGNFKRQLEGSEKDLSILRAKYEKLKGISQRILKEKKELQTTVEDMGEILIKKYSSPPEDMLSYKFCKQFELDEDERPSIGELGGFFPLVNSQDELDSSRKITAEQQIKILTRDLSFLRQKYDKMKDDYCYERDKCQELKALRTERLSRNVLVQTDVSPANAEHVESLKKQISTLQEKVTSQREDTEKLLTTIKHLKDAKVDVESQQWYEKDSLEGAEFGGSGFVNRHHVMEIHAYSLRLKKEYKKLKEKYLQLKESKENIPTCSTTPKKKTAEMVESFAPSARISSTATGPFPEPSAEVDISISAPKRPTLRVFSTQPADKKTRDECNTQ